jgi:hypothetical protein
MQHRSTRRPNAMAGTATVRSQISVDTLEQLSVLSGFGPEMPILARDSRDSLFEIRIAHVCVVEP